MFGVKTRLPFSPVININKPHDAIMPRPTVRMGILDPFITSTKAKHALRSPPREHIPNVNSLILMIPAL